MPASSRILLKNDCCIHSRSRRSQSFFVLALFCLPSATASLARWLHVTYRPSIADKLYPVELMKSCRLIPSLKPETEVNRRDVLGLSSKVKMVK